MPVQSDPPLWSTPNCLSVKMASGSNQELEIAFVYNPNNEVEKIKNPKAAVTHLADNGCENQLTIGDYNSSMNEHRSWLRWLCSRSTSCIQRFSLRTSGGQRLQISSSLWSELHMESTQHTAVIKNWYRSGQPKPNKWCHRDETHLESI